MATMMISITMIIMIYGDDVDNDDDSDYDNYDIWI